MTGKDLFNQCDGLVPSYPPGTCKLPPDYPVAGRGFFPVVSGSFHSGSLATPITPRKLLFVGQDWGCEGNLSNLGRDKDADIKSGTGKILLDLLNETGIPLEECFFTNALFGVREGKTNTGSSPGWSDKVFCKNCKEALILQINNIKPKAIICLGRDAPKLLAAIFGKLSSWKCSGGFRKIDELGQTLIELDPVEHGLIAATILVHPSFRHTNAKQRAFHGKTGNDAELEILKTLWDKVK